MYWDRYPQATAISFFLLPVALFSLPWLWQHSRDMRFVVAITAAYGLAHHTAYSFLGVPPYHWYYLHQMIPTVFIGSLGIAYVVHSVLCSRHRLGPAGAYLTVLVPVAGIAYLVQLSGLPLREAPIHTNWGNPGHYYEVGSWLRENIDPAAVIDTKGEIGTVTFFSERYLRNEFSDMNVTTAWIAAGKYRERPRIGWLYRVNFYWRREQPALPPPTYLLEWGEFDNGGPDGGDVVKSWPTSTIWIPRGRIYLHKLAGADQPLPAGRHADHRDAPDLVATP